MTTINLMRDTAANAKPFANGQALQQDEVPKRKRFITGKELLLRGTTELPTLWDPLFPQQGVVGLVGSSDTGKSSFTRQLAIAVCAGEKSFLGMPLHSRFKSVIVAITEDDEGPIEWALNKQNEGLEFIPDQFEGIRYTFDTENLIPNLVAELQEQPADLVIIDTFGDLFDGDNNSNSKVRSFLNQYREKIARPFGCLVLILHHTGKRTDDYAPSKHNAIGSQGFEAKMRALLELRLDRDDDKIRHLCVVKGNYLPAKYKRSSFVLHFDEHMVFRNTGDRIPFEQLAKPDYPNKREERRQVIEEIIKLKKEGLTHEQVGERVGRGKSNISKILKKEGLQH
jgi:hypothetical protein